jgi:phospholipid/cholesterol/gamma-HCH transport system substrate-binding protein
MNTTRSRGDLITFVAAILVAAALVLWFVDLGGGISGASGYQIDAVVPTGASLSVGARVTMAGLDVGTVKKVTRDGDGARVTLEIDNDSVTPISEDSHVRVRQRTPVGENYVAIDAGNSSTKLPSGSVLAMSQADDYVDVDQLLSVLRGRSQENARRMITALGGSLGGRGEQLNSLLGDTAGSLKSGARVIDVLATDRKQVSRLVLELGDVANAVGDRSAAIETLGHQGLTSLRAIADSDQDLASFLHQLPPTLSQVKQTSETLDDVTNRATPVVSRLADAVHDVDPAVSHLAPAAREGRRVVDQLGRAAPGLETTMSEVHNLAGPAEETLPDFHKTLCQINPMLRYIKPYRDDLTSNLVGLGSAANSYDAVGHLIRLTPILTENALVGLPDEVSRAAHTLFHAGALKEVSGLSFDPFPKPGSIGEDTGMSDAVGPDDVPKTGYKYPRITPDC